MDSHGFEFAWRIWCLDIVQVLRVLQRVNSKLLSSPPFHPYLWCLQGMLNQSSDVNCIWLILIVFVFLKILTVWDTLGNFEGPSAERQCGPAKRSVQITGTLICHQTGLRSSHKTTQNHIKIQKKIQKKYKKTSKNSPPSVHMAWARRHLSHKHIRRVWSIRGRFEALGCFWKKRFNMIQLY